MKIKRRIRFAILVVSYLLPIREKRRIHGRFLRWGIDTTVNVGWPFLDVEQVIPGPGPRIDYFNVLRNFARLELSNNSGIGEWNWCTAANMTAAVTKAHETGSLTVGSQATMTLRHCIDYNGGVMIGELTTVAGVQSTILIHPISISASRKTAVATMIGPYCFIGSAERMTTGLVVPDQCVVAMGAVVAGKLPDAKSLLQNRPATSSPIAVGAEITRPRADPDGHRAASEDRPRGFATHSRRCTGACPPSRLRESKTSIALIERGICRD